MKTVRFSSSVRKTTDVLSNGKILVYFDEQVVKEKDYDEEGKEIGEHDTYTYLRVKVDAPLDKGEIVNAIIRGGSMVYNDEGIERTIGPFSQSDAEAIIRHKLNGDDAGEFDDFNTFAEFAKAEADKILNAD